MPILLSVLIINDTRQIKKTTYFKGKCFGNNLIFSSIKEKDLIPLHHLAQTFF